MYFEHAHNFKSICYPGLRAGSFTYESYLNTLRDISYNNGEDVATFFSVHHTTDVFNDEWELKCDSIYLYFKGKLYFIKSLGTNYEESIEFDKDNYYYRLSPQEIFFRYCKKSETDGYNYHECTIPRDEWKLLNLILKVDSLPIISKTEGTIELPEEISNALIGEKFPLTLARGWKESKRDKDQNLLIWKDDVIKVLRESSKNEAATYFEQSTGKYIPFSSGSFKII